MLYAGSADLASQRCISGDATLSGVTISMNRRYQVTFRMSRPQQSVPLGASAFTTTFLSGVAVLLLGGMIGCASAPGRKPALPAITTVMPASSDRTLQVLTQTADALTPLQIVLGSLGTPPTGRRVAPLDHPAAGVLSNPSIERLPAQLQERMRSYFETNRATRPAATLEVTGDAWRLVGPQERDSAPFVLVYRATIRAHLTDLAGKTTLRVTERCAPQPRTLPLSKWQSAQFENVRETAIAYVAECAEQVERRFPDIFEPS